MMAMVAMIIIVIVVIKEINNTLLELIIQFFWLLAGNTRPTWRNAIHYHQPWAKSQS